MNDAAWQRLSGAGGILFIVLQVASQSLIQVGGSEPAFAADAGEILAFFGSRNPDLFRTGSAISVISVIPFLWFVGGLWNRLRQEEGRSHILSGVALASGIVAAGLEVTAAFGWTLAMFRSQAGIDAQIARLLFDLGNLCFATMWVPLASMLLAAAAVSVAGSWPARWLGWGGAVVGLLLVAARVFWDGPAGLVFIPYVLFWLWTLVICVLLMRRSGVAPAGGTDE